MTAGCGQAGQRVGSAGGTSCRRSWDIHPSSGRRRSDGRRCTRTCRSSPPSTRAEDDVATFAVGAQLEHTPGLPDDDCRHTPAAAVVIRRFRASHTVGRCRQVPLAYASRFEDSICCCGVRRDASPRAGQHSPLSRFRILQSSQKLVHRPFLRSGDWRRVLIRTVQYSSDSSPIDLDHAQHTDYVYVFAACPLTLGHRGQER